MRGEVRTHFERELSLAAVGRKLAAAYRQLSERAHRPGAIGVSPECTAPPAAAP
jgi:hypothetical protein